MSFLLDTNVVSDWVKPRPDPGLAAWLHGADEDRCHLSVVTLGELRRGVERLPPGRRRWSLEAWLGHDLPARFDGRVILIDQAIADRWGRLMASRDSQGRPIGTGDALIAATAFERGLTLVTRNVDDFVALDVALLNPWSGS